MSVEVKKETQILPVELTLKERDEMADKVVHRDNEIVEREHFIKKAQEKIKDLRAEIKDIKSDRDIILDRLKSGYMDKEVEVEITTDYKKKTTTTARVSDGTVIKSEPLTAEKNQIPMNLAEPAPETSESAPDTPPEPSFLDLADKSEK